MLDRNSHFQTTHNVGRFTILLLTGVALGAGATNWWDPDMLLLIASCGVVGILAFIGLEAVSEQREVDREVRHRRNMEHRLLRHITAPVEAPPALCPQAELYEQLRSIRL